MEDWQKFLVRLAVIWGLLIPVGAYVYHRWLGDDRGLSGEEDYMSSLGEKIAIAAFLLVGLAIISGLIVAIFFTLS